MALRNSSVLVDGTVATTGGTATTLLTKDSNAGRHDLVLDDGTTLSGQTLISASYKPPKVNSSSPSGYTQGRNTVYIQVPFTVPSTSLLTSNTVRIEFSTDIETTDAVKLSMRVLAAQMLTDSEFVNYWDNQLLD